MSDFSTDAQPSSATDALDLALSALEVLPDAIPAELSDEPQWILWRLEPPDKEGDAARKMPYQIGNCAAKSNEPSTWATFTKAHAAYLRSRDDRFIQYAKREGNIFPATIYSGIGYVFVKESGIIGVDLDCCRNPETGTLTPWAIEIIERFKSYSEVSPSGTGIKIWCRGRLPIETTGKKIEYHDGAVEVYSFGRYFAVTGHKLPDAPPTVNEAQPVIDWLWAKLFLTPGGSQQNGRKHNGRPKGCRADRPRVIERARKYLATLPPAISGQNGSKPTFHAACILVLGFDLSVEEAFPLLAEYSERCEPPWSEKELWHKLHDADKKPGERGYLLNDRRGPEPATATISVEGVGEIELSIAPAKGSRPQREVTAEVGDVRHVDSLNVASSASRERFVDKLAEKAKAPRDALASALDSKLVEVANAADANATQGKGDAPDDAPRSQASIIVELAAGWELWHTPAGDAYATIAVGKHQEHWPIRSQAFKRLVSKTFYDAMDSVANAEALAAAVNVIEAQAVHDGDEHPVFVRVAEHNDDVYVDLCDAEWRAVEITATGWRIVDNPPVRFRRTKCMMPLPMPERGGSVDDLWPFVNVAKDDRPLVVAWLVAAFRPRGPYPVLALFATQGAGKSSAAKYLRALVDPNAVMLRAEPHDVHDLMISAALNWSLTFDNLSKLPVWLSDAICRLSTGGGYATRELWTDADEVSFDAVRPVILTSIVELAERSDLLDRCVTVALPPIGERERRDERTLEAEFYTARPKILGALFDAVAGALRELPSVNLEHKPRMADFAQWATAAESVLGWPPGTFIVAYTRNRNSANELALEASPIASKLIEYLTQAGACEPSAGELLAALDATFTGDKRPLGWPKNARALSSHVRRLAPNLLAAGWRVEFGKKSSDGKRRLMTFAPVGSDATAPTPDISDGRPSEARISTAKTLFPDATDDTDASAGLPRPASDNANGRECGEL